MVLGGKQFVPMMPIRSQSDQQYQHKNSGSSFRPSDQPTIGEKSKMGGGMSLKSNVYEP